MGGWRLQQVSLIRLLRELGKRGTLVADSPAEMKRDPVLPRTDASLRLIAVEAYAGLLGDYATKGAADETTVVAEGLEGPPLRWPHRVLERLSQLEDRGRSLCCAVLLVGPRVDPQTVAARELVARALVAHMTVAGGGELVVATDRADADSRQALMTLVDTLLSENAGCPVTIRLVFRPEEAERPVYARAAPVASLQSLAT